MTYHTLDQRSASLRPETHIADAVLQLGLFKVLTTAIRAWWSRPRLPPDLPAHLRADIGLPAIDRQIVRANLHFGSVDFDRYS